MRHCHVPGCGGRTTRVEKSPGHPLWPHAETLWGGLIDHAGGICGHFARRHAENRNELLGARELLKLAEDVPARAVIETAWAMYLLLEDRPRRFTSDDAFRAQLVRRARGLSDVNVGEWFDAREGRVKRAYRDLPPHAWKLLAKWLASAFGGSGVFLAQLELRQREEKQQQK